MRATCELGEHECRVDSRAQEIRGSESAGDIGALKSVIRGDVDSDCFVVLRDGVRATIATRRDDPTPYVKLPVGKDRFVYRADRMSFVDGNAVEGIGHERDVVGDRTCRGHRHYSSSRRSTCARRITSQRSAKCGSYRGLRPRCSILEAATAISSNVRTELLHGTLALIPP